MVPMLPIKPMTSQIDGTAPAMTHASVRMEIVTGVKSLFRAFSFAMTHSP